MCIAYFVILLMRKNMGCITVPSNIEGIYNSYYPANYSSFTCHI